MSSTPATPLYTVKCKLCPRVFTSKRWPSEAQQTYRRHVNARHSDNCKRLIKRPLQTWRCDPCGQSFKTQQGLCQHKRSKTHNNVVRLMGTAGSSSAGQTPAAAVDGSDVTIPGQRDATPSSRGAGRAAKSSSSSKTASGHATAAPSSNPTPTAPTLRVHAGHTKPGQPKGSKLIPIIKEAMQAKGLSLNDMSRRLRLKVNSFGDILAGRVKPSQGMINKIGELLDRPTSLLKFVFLGADGGWNDDHEMDVEGEEEEEEEGEDEAGTSA